MSIFESKNKNRIKSIVIGCLFWLIISALVFPSLRLAFFSFPSEDDWYYGYNALNLLKEGYNPITMAVHYTSEYRQYMGGLYSSTFLGYFFAGITALELPKLRFVILCDLLFFYFALYIITSSVVCKLMRSSCRVARLTYLVQIFFLNGVIYYADNEAYYWFIASIQYLLLLSFGLLGCALYICAYDSKKTINTILFSIGAICTTISCGANLSLVAFICCSCILIVFIMWRKNNNLQNKLNSLWMFPPFFGAFYNVMAPGYAVRAKGGKSLFDIIGALIAANSYTFDRVLSILGKPEVLLVILLYIVIITLIFHDYNIMSRMIHPLFYICIGYGIVILTVFPVILGYGYDTYIICMRAVFLSDVAIIILMTNCIMYIIIWFREKYGKICTIELKRELIRILVILALINLFRLRSDEWRWVSIARQYRELSIGLYEVYSEYNESVIESVAGSNEDPVIIRADIVEDKTCMMRNGYVYNTTYDMNTPTTNSDIARFFDKQAVYIYSKK